MRLPAEENDALALPLRPRRLRQHPLLRAFHQLEFAEAELVGVDHPLDQPVAVVARLDPVDLAVQRLVELGDLAEVGQPLVGEALRDREGVFGALEVGAHGVDGARLAVGRDVGLHRRHPVAEEHVDVALGQPGVGDRHRQHADVGLVAERAQHGSRDRRGRGDVAPAHVREAHGAAGLGLGGERGAGGEGAQGGESDKAHQAKSSRKIAAASTGNVARLT